MFDMDANQPPAVNTTAMTGTGSVNVDNTTAFCRQGGTCPRHRRHHVGPVPNDAGRGRRADIRAGAYNIGHTKLYGVGPPPSTVAKARFVRYFIDSTTDPAHPTLMVDRMGGAAAQPLADDIEDMQLTYAIDTSSPADGVVDVWTSNPATPSQIRQVRLQFVARTRLPEAGWAETRPALGNHPGGGTADGYRRRIYDVVIDVRNSGV